MDDNFGATIVELIDDEDNKYQLEHLDTLELEDRLFMAFTPVTDEDEYNEDFDEEIGIIILESVEEDGEEIFATVEDEELLERVFEKFMERVEELESQLDQAEELE
ncbi:MAG: DUF1292 domain-containing protein [Eubacteriales bacterium]|jgi:hypothetical protein